MAPQIEDLEPSNFTKAEAQAELDALLRDQQQGGPKRDGSMTSGRASISQSMRAIGHSGPAPTLITSGGTTFSQL